MTLKQRRDAYKQFFLNTDAGRDLLEQAKRQESENVHKAQNTNSLDFLSRSTGNREVIDLIENVLKTEGKPKE